MKFSRAIHHVSVETIVTRRLSLDSVPSAVRASDREEHIRGPPHLNQQKFKKCSALHIFDQCPPIILLQINSREGKVLGSE